MEEDRRDDLYLEDLELLLNNVDVLGSPGVFWTVVGTGVMLFLFAATAAWRLSCRLKGTKA